MPRRKADAERLTAGEADPGIYDETVADRARYRADDARISTLDRFGENLRAVAVIEKRLARAITASQSDDASPTEPTSIDTPTVARATSWSDWFESFTSPV